MSVARRVAQYRARNIQLERANTDDVVFGALVALNEACRMRAQRYAMFGIHETEDCEAAIHFTVLLEAQANLWETWLT